MSLFWWFVWCFICFFCSWCFSNSSCCRLCFRKKMPKRIVYKPKNEENHHTRCTEKMKKLNPGLLLMWKYERHGPRRKERDGCVIPVSCRWSCSIRCDGLGGFAFQVMFAFFFRKPTKAWVCFNGFCFAFEIRLELLVLKLLKQIL